jgi:hypothetical protein
MGANLESLAPGELTEINSVDLSQRDLVINN